MRALLFMGTRFRVLFFCGFENLLCKAIEKFRDMEYNYIVIYKGFCAVDA